MSQQPQVISENDHANPANHQTSVLVVGAGPTGLLLASELQRCGVPCSLIDARPAPLHWDRATVIHPRSLEVFKALGLVNQFLEAGCRQYAIKLHAEGAAIGTIDLSTCGSSYGYNLGLSEEVTESILTNYLEEQGGKVARSSRLVGLTLHSDRVIADIEHQGKDDQIEARWVVGCDGLHSQTRELSGISFEGHSIAKPWAVFDATLEGWAESFEANFVYLEALPVILTSLPNQRWRIYTRPSSPESDLVAEALSILRLYHPTVSFIDVENPTRFHCHTKVATKFRSGPVFLAGDAAHVCSPAEGHGMNSGLQDAFNLAWKLALVYHGIADSSLLDSYEAERRPVAEMITQSGDATEQIQTMTSPTERKSRNQAIKDIFADSKTRHHEVVAEAEMNIDYARSPIVYGSANHPLGPGQRLPTTIHVQWSNEQSCYLHELTSCTGHTLLLLEGTAAPTAKLVELFAALQKFITISPLFEVAIALSARSDRPESIGQFALADAELFDIRDATLLVVRPDGYIGLRAEENYMSTLQHYCTLIRTGKS